MKNEVETAPAPAPCAAARIAVGDRVRYTFTHVLQTVTVVATVARVSDDRVWLRFSARVMALPFPPVARGHLLVVRRDAAERAVVR